MNLKNWISIILAIVAIGLSLYTLNAVNKVKIIARSDIEIEERNTLMTPIMDEASGQTSFLAVYEIGITNSGPVSIVLSDIAKITDGAGFMVPLNGSEILSTKLDYKAFLVAPKLGEIEADPRLIKTVADKDMGDKADVGLVIESGQTKSVRIGVMVNAYSPEGAPLAQVVLVSYKLEFDNGKVRVFRRGFPISPLF